MVLENFRPGVMTLLALGWEQLAAPKPRLVMCSVSGYVEDGPWRDRRAYAAVVHAEMGLLEAGGGWRADAAGDGDARGHMAQDPMSHAYGYPGLHTSSAILATLLQRERTGRGQWVDVDVAEAMLYVDDFTHWDLSPVDPGEHRPSLAPPFSPIVTTGDGRAAVVAGDPAAPGVFEQYRVAMERPALCDDPRLPTPVPRANRPALLALVEAWARGSPDALSFEARLNAAGIAKGAMGSPGDASATEWTRARSAIATVDGDRGRTLRIPEAPWGFSDGPTGVHGTPADRGEHNREVLAELLGLDDETLDRLVAEGVLSARLPRA